MTTLAPDWFNFAHVRAVVQAFSPHADALRFVGGCVRDSLLGREVQDIDAATPLQPEQVMQLLADAGIKAIPTGLKHGTVTAVSHGQPIEITTLRKDTACDGRHATVEFTGSWQEDASRRDFTMNALYLSPQGELFDYSGGKEDAEAGRVRFIGDARKRIEEDYLRILRFFRFFGYYGRTAPDREALAACAECREGLTMLSGARIQAEMLKLMSAANPLPALTLMHEARLYNILMLTGELSRITALLAVERETHIATAQATRLATLVQQGRIEALAERWKLSVALRDELHRLHEEGIDPVLDLAGQKKALRRMGKDNFIQKLLFDWALNGKHNYPVMLKLALNWNIPEFPVTGADLKARGVNEGRQLGDMLRKLERRWESSDYCLTKEQLLSE
ncbi:MAG: CCA tRNA nucleotidyltransferase [Alphaproteobacteria bacterium]